MKEETLQANHSEESQEQDTRLHDAFEAFGIELKEEEITTEENDDEQTEILEEEPPTTEEEPKGIKVKYLKEEQFIPDEEVPTYVQKGLNHDRILQQKTEYEKVLDEVARREGFKDHADFIQNQDAWKQRVEQQHQQQQTDWENQLLHAFETNLGVEQQQAKQLLDFMRENDPVVKQAKQAVAQYESQSQQQTLEQAQRDIESTVQQLRTKYNDFDKYADQAFDMVLSGEVRDLERAYKLASMDEKITSVSKQAEQKAIKQQQLGLRSQVETKPSATNEKEVPEALKGAFAMFGLDPSAAKKYVK